MDKASTDRELALRDAHQLLRAALELLDEAAAPAQIGGHVDLAAHQLGALLPTGRERSDNPSVAGLAAG